MTVVFDTLTRNAAGASSDITVNHTKGASANYALCFYFGRGSSAGVPPTVVSVSYDTDTTPTLLRTRTENRIRTSIYAVNNPPSGSRPFRIVVSGEQSSVAAVATYVGVNLGTPTDTDRVAGSTSADPGVTLTTKTTTLVVDALAANNPNTITVDTDQTLRLDTDSGLGTSVVAGISEEVGAASVTMGWTLDGSQIWAMAAVSLEPSGGGSYGFIL